MEVLCGCGDASVRRVWLESSGGKWKAAKVHEQHLPDTVVDPAPAPALGRGENPAAKPSKLEKNWAKVRHVAVAADGMVLCGKEGGTMFHLHDLAAKAPKNPAITPVAGGHAEHVSAVAKFPKWGDKKVGPAGQASDSASESTCTAHARPSNSVTAGRVDWTRSGLT